MRWNSLRLRGINRLLVEGGAQSRKAFWKPIWSMKCSSSRIPVVIGPQGIDAIAEMPLAKSR